MMRTRRRRDLLFVTLGVAAIVCSSAGAVYLYGEVESTKDDCETAFQDYCLIKSFVGSDAVVADDRKFAKGGYRDLDDINSLLEAVAKRVGIPVKKVRRVSPQTERKVDGEGVERPVRVFLIGLDFRRLIEFIDHLEKSRDYLEVTEIVIEDTGSTEGSDVWSLDLSLSLFSL